MAQVRLIVTDSATGDFFRLSTRSTPDKIIMRRSIDRSNAHEHTFSLEEWNAMQDDLGLRPASANSHIQIYLVIEDSDRDASELVSRLQGELAALQERHDKGIAELGRALDEANGQRREGAIADGRLTPEQTDLLRERDALICLLLPFASEDDTPVGLLTRLLSGRDGAESGVQTPDQRTGHSPADANLAGPDGRPPGPPVVEGSDDPALKTKDEEAKPLAFDREAFAKELADKARPELAGLAAPLGITGAAQMNEKKLRKAIIAAEMKKHATVPAGPPQDTARPDGEQPQS